MKAVSWGLTALNILPVQAIIIIIIIIIIIVIITIITIITINSGSHNVLSQERGAVLHLNDGATIRVIFIVKGGELHEDIPRQLRQIIELLQVKEDLKYHPTR